MTVIVPLRNAVPSSLNKKHAARPLVVIEEDRTEYDVVAIFKQLEKTTKMVEALDEAIRDCPHCSEKYESIRGIQELNEVDL